MIRQDSDVLTRSYTVSYVSGITVAVLMKKDIDNGNGNHTIAHRLLQLREVFQLAVFAFLGTLFRHNSEDRMVIGYEHVACDERSTGDSSNPIMEKT